MQSYRTFKFLSSKKEDHVKRLEVKIVETVDPQYGLFTWPCAPVLAQYIFYNQNLVKDKVVIELGCGTGLAGIVCGKLGSDVILSDGHQFQNCLENCIKSCDLNLLKNTRIIPITWGRITRELLELKDIDLIIASDCFYDKKDFEDIIVTVSFLIQQNPHAVFWTTYQLRSCNYSIAHLLMKWNLKYKEISLKSFEADGPLVGNNDLSSKHFIQMIEISSNDAKEISDEMEI